MPPTTPRRGNCERACWTALPSGLGGDACLPHRSRRCRQGVLDGLLLPSAELHPAQPAAYGCTSSVSSPSVPTSSMAWRRGCRLCWQPSASRLDVQAVRRLPPCHCSCDEAFERIQRAGHVPRRLRQPTGQQSPPASHPLPSQHPPPAPPSGRTPAPRCCRKRSGAQSSSSLRCWLPARRCLTCALQVGAAAGTAPAAEAGVKPAASLPGHAPGLAELEGVHCAAGDCKGRLVPQTTRTRHPIHVRTCRKAREVSCGAGRPAGLPGAAGGGVCRKGFPRRRRAQVGCGHSCGSCLQRWLDSSALSMLAGAARVSLHRCALRVLVGCRSSLKHCSSPCTDSCRGSDRVEAPDLQTAVQLAILPRTTLTEPQVV